MKKKMKYKIQINYDTGDSFHNETDCTETLNMSWDNLDKAKQALKDIKEHHEFYMFMKQTYEASKSQQEKYQRKARRKPWHCGENKDQYEFYGLMLENDEGERVHESAFWCGYFESLNGAEIIVPIDEDDLKFEV